MAQTFAVEYNIIVNSEQAMQAIAQFQKAALQLDQLSTRFSALTQSIGKVNSALISIGKTMPVVRVDTSPAQRSIKQLTTQLQGLQRAVSVKANMDATQATATMNNIVSGMALIGTPQTIKLTANAHGVFATIRGVKRALKTMTAASSLPYSIDGMAGIGTAIGNIEKAGKYLNKHTITPKANVGKALESLNLLSQKLNEIKSNSNITITATAAGGSAAANTLLIGSDGKSKGGGKLGNVSAPKQPSGALSKPYGTRQALGPTYINSGGTVAGSMLKSMGIMYGITSVFSAIDNAFNDAIDYENISQTTKNILKTHDRRRNFEQEFVKMEKTMREVGVETKFTAPEVASAGKFLAMAGLNTSDISNAIRPIANIALVGDNELGETADVVTNIMTGFEIPATQMNNVADILTMTFTKTNTTLMELAESFKYASTVANQAGLSFEQTSAAFGILGNAGIKGSSAGTTLRMMLNNILNPTKGQQEAWKTLGVSTKDEAGNLRNFTDIMLDLHEKSKQMGSGEFTSTFYKAFRITAATGALALVRNAKALQKVENANIYDSYGLSENLAEQKKMTIQGLWMQMTSAFTEAGMKGFEKLQNVIRGLLLDIINAFKTDSFVDGLRSAMQTFLDILKGVLSIAGKIGQIWADTPQWIKSAAVIFVQIQMTLSVISGIAKNILGVFTLLNSRMIVGFVGGLAKAVLGMNKLFSSTKALLVLTNRHTIARGVKSLFAGAAGNAAVTATTSATTSYVTSGAIAGASNAASKVNIFTALGGLGKALFATPFGLALLGVGGAFAIYNTISNIVEKTKESISLNKKWIHSYSVGGADGSKVTDATQLMIGHFNIIKSQQLDEAQRVQELTRYYNEYWKAKNGEENEEKDEGKAFKEGGGQRNELYKKGLEQVTRNAVIYDLFREEYWKGFQENGLVTNQFGHIQIPGTGFTRENNIDKWLKEESNQIHLLMAQAAISPDNPELKKLEGYLHTNLFKANTKEDLNKILTQAHSYKLPDVENTSSIDSWLKAQGATEEDFKRDYFYVNAFNQAVIKKITQFRDDYSIMDDALNHKAVSTSRLQASLASRFDILFDKALGEFGSEKYRQNLLDLASNPSNWAGYKNLTTDQVAKRIEESLTNFFNWYQTLQSVAKPLYSRFLNLSAFPELPNVTMPTGGYVGGKEIGEKRKIGNVEYEWKFEAPTGVGYWYDKKTGKRTSSLPEDLYSDSTLQNDFNDNNDNNPYGSKTDESEYKSHYNSSSAAPKQIIVKIENLMRVDSQTIDMTDDRQVAAVENIKQELATALLDVVQDFNANI